LFSVDDTRKVCRWTFGTEPGLIRNPIYKYDVYMVMKWKKFPASVNSQDHLYRESVIQAGS